MGKVVGRILVGMIIAFLILVVYTIWDNNRVTVVEQDIKIADLPSQLDGFSILQITDLHEKQFGKDQRKLVKAINSIDYDVLVFTGDIVDSADRTEGFYTVLEGINNKENVLFVTGNADPPSYQLSPSFGKSEYIKGMEDRGVRFLESIDTIEVDGENIRFVNFELAIIEEPDQIGNINGTVTPTYASNKQYQAYQKDLWQEMTDQNDLKSEDILIALNHYPVVDARMDYIKNDPATTWRAFDLIIAGHYHGGQIRLPFLGALFVPEPWYDSGSLFPPKNRVKGLWEYKGAKQYVSTGLGSSEAIPYLKFRVFNSPEINLLTLVHN